MRLVHGHSPDSGRIRRLLDIAVKERKAALVSREVSASGKRVSLWYGLPDGFPEKQASGDHNKAVDLTPLAKVLDTFNVRAGEMTAAFNRVADLLERSYILIESKPSKG